jgi:Tol biopolymer transport system component
LVAVADQGVLSLWTKTQGGFSLLGRAERLDSSEFSFICEPPTLAFRRNDGIYIGTPEAGGIRTERLTSKKDADPTLSSLSETEGFLLATRTGTSLLRYQSQRQELSGPLVIAQHRADALSGSSKPGPTRTWLVWSRTDEASTSLLVLPEDTKPPQTEWLYPKERSVIAGDIPLRVQAKDDVGLADEPSLYVAEESLPQDELGSPIECIKKRPGFAPGPPAEIPPQLGKKDCRPTKTPTPTFALVPQEKPDPISAPDQELVFETDFDTRALPDGWYRFLAKIPDTSSNSAFEVLDPYIDNTPPQVGIDSPLTDTLVQDRVDVFGTVTDTTLSYWDLFAVIDGVGTKKIASSNTAVLSGYLGTYKTTDAPAGYQGPVNLVLAATDSAAPSPNTSSYTRRVFSDDPRDAYGFLRTSPTYELSSTVPITADISGELDHWVLEAYIEGETTPSLTPPSYTNQGNTGGQGVPVGAFDVRAFGPGRVTFLLKTYDIEGDLFEDQSHSQFLWREMRLSITSPYLDGALSGTIPVEGFIEGSNVWAWALGIPVSDSAPSFSPDGGLLVFESTRELFFEGPLGGPVPSTKDIWIVGSDGKGLRRLTGGPGNLSYGYNSNPSFSPDGAKVIFSSTRDGNSEIYEISVEGTGLKNLTSHPAQDSFPTYSPDGRAIAFVSDRDGPPLSQALWLMDVDGSNPQKLLELEGGIRSPDFSPDGKRIVFEAGTPGHQQIYQIYLTDTQNPQLLTDPSQADAYADPSFSPDGAWIAYTRQPGPDIWVMSSDGRTHIRITSDPAADTDPVFSADSRYLVFASDRSGTAELYKKDPWDGAQPEQLLLQDPAGPHQDRLPDISPRSFPFPPAPTDGPAPKIDISSFVEGSYLKEPPNQFPKGERPQGVLGHIDTSLLRPGVVSLMVVGLQCPSPPPSFVFRIPRQYDQETSDTIEALSSCRAYSARQTIRVEVSSASLQTNLDLHRQGPGYAGPLSLTETYSGRGAWIKDDRYLVEDDPLDQRPGPLPRLIREGGQMWAKGPPATSGDDHRPVGDLLALGPLGDLMTDPSAGLMSLSGSQPQEQGIEEFAPGRWGMRLVAQMPQGSSSFGGASYVVCWQEQGSGLLGAIYYSYQIKEKGSFAPLPQGSSWGPPQATTLDVSVKMVFSSYNGDAFIPKVPEAGG